MPEGDFQEELSDQDQSDLQLLQEMEGQPHHERLSLYERCTKVPEEQDECILQPTTERSIDEIISDLQGSEDPEEDNEERVDDDEDSSPPTLSEAYQAVQLLRRFAEANSLAQERFSESFFESLSRLQRDVEGVHHDSTRLRQTHLPYFFGSSP